MVRFSWYRYLAVPRLELGTSVGTDEQFNLYGRLAGELSEELVTLEKRKKGWRMNCDVGEATEELENEL